MSNKDLLASLKMIHGLSAVVDRKHCIRCGKDKVVSEDKNVSEFYSKGRPGEWASYCRTCQSERNKLKRK